MSMYFNSSSKISYWLSRYRTAAFHALYSLLTSLTALRLAQKPLAREASCSLSLRVAPMAMSCLDLSLNSIFFDAASFDVMGLGIPMKLLIISSGRADKPTPPNRQSPHHPTKDIPAIANMGNETGMFINVLEFSWFNKEYYSVI